ncbi:MAG TPA: hypothetical protein VM716_05350 [Gemmatimonadales bacterium]|nr:hypothetical protein [Gemmatimonadales bacterium]
MKCAWLCLCAVAPLAAQGPTSGFGLIGRTGIVVDGYAFGSPYAFDHIVEWTLPVSLTRQFGPRFAVDLSSGYARASAKTTSGTFVLSGATDTDVRASWAAVPSHLIVTIVGTLPTGKKAVPDSTLPLLSALATELFGFTTARFGTGGGVTGGFGTAFKVGERWAIGVGGSYRWYARYTPVAGGSTLEPGGEGRARFGVEGPIGSRGYLRSAVVFATSGVDTLSAGSRSVSGPRFLVYSGLSLPAGRGSLFLYAYDRYRLRPNGYDTTVVQVPRGNVLALGARLERPLSPAVNLAPNVEFRDELVAGGGGGGAGGGATGGLVLLGWLVRPGVDLRYRASGTVTLLVQGQMALGRVAANGASVSLVGPRAVLLLEWVR